MSLCVAVWLTVDAVTVATNCIKLRFPHRLFSVRLPRMRNLTSILCLTIAVLFGSAGMSWSADFQKGITAYEISDYATALREWTPLAKQGNANAQTLLGAMYEEEKGVPQDYKTAVKWYRLAAEQGGALAPTRLGFMYYKGKGVSQNIVFAYMW